MIGVGVGLYCISPHSFSSYLYILMHLCSWLTNLPDDDDDDDQFFYFFVLHSLAITQCLVELISSAVWLAGDRQLIFWTAVDGSVWNAMTFRGCRPATVFVGARERDQFTVYKWQWVVYKLQMCLLVLLVEFSAFSGRSRPPMTPVFSDIRSFLYMFIFHVVALHPVYHHITLSPTSSSPFHSVS